MATKKKKSTRRRRSVRGLGTISDQYLYHFHNDHPAFVLKYLDMVHPPSCAKIPDRMLYLGWIAGTLKYYEQHGQKVPALVHQDLLKKYNSYKDILGKCAVGAHPMGSPAPNQR